MSQWNEIRIYERSIKTEISKNWLNQNQLANQYNRVKIAKLFPDCLSNDLEARIHENTPLGKNNFSYIKRFSRKPLVVYLAV